MSSSPRPSDRDAHVAAQGQRDPTDIAEEFVAAALTGAPWETRDGDGKCWVERGVGKDTERFIESVSGRGAVLGNPTLDRSLAPDAARGKLTHRLGKALDPSDLIGALFADAQEGGDLRDADEFHVRECRA